MNTKTKQSETAAAAKPAHTPGPWKVVEAAGEVTVFDNGAPRLVARCGKWFRADDQANARLIAAAPELLQALKRCVDEIKALANDCLTQAKARQWLENCEPYWNGKSAIQKAEAAQQTQ